MSHQQVIKIRHQRSAFASSRHIPFPEVRDNIDSGPLADDARLADLEGGSHLLAQKRRSLALVKNRLAVAANQLNGFKWDLRPLYRFLESFDV